MNERTELKQIANHLSKQWRNHTGAEGSRQEEKERASLLLHASLAFQNAQLLEVNANLKKEATRDPLTGALNRRGLEQAIVAQDKKHGAFILLDMNKFKDINDIYGHEAGDIVLSKFANVARKILHAYDGSDAAKSNPHHRGGLLARIGGDEFVIFLPGSKLKDGEQMAKHIADTFAKSPFRYGSDKFFASISAGVSRWASGMDMERAKAVADTNMYEAKRRGRAITITLEGESTAKSRSLAVLDPA